MRQKVRVFVDGRVKWQQLRSRQKQERCKGQLRFCQMSSPTSESDSIAVDSASAHEAAVTATASALGSSCLGYASPSASATDSAVMGMDRSVAGPNDLDEPKSAAATGATGSAKGSASESPRTAYDILGKSSNE